MFVTEGQIKVNIVMSSFIGDYLCKIDSKGRALLPAAFKKHMPVTAGDRFVIKKDIYENCLILYTQDEWEKQNALLRSRLNPYNKDHSQLLRAYYRGTAEVSLDASNRLLLPKRLLDLAGIGKEVYMSGQDKKIEIWAKEVYETNGIDEDKFASLAENILGGLNPS
ncbi:MAG: division/cell wall cluster transcriptional repressor MraZ [Bacteroidetes bacterium]|nr:MAG: division/cell wall cluster transcriptional repressor MraZ [Bacteroidota bacterium]RLD86292.1 MAG: division/cell wall cluster transcriptional repressor MraZ [Bacteroidota bacterium]